MKLKTRVLGAASALAIAGSMLALAAPAANATVTSGGSCTGATQLGTITPGLTNHTAANVVSTKLLKQIDGTKSVLGGTCDGLVARPSDNLGQPPATIHPKAIASKLSGAASCIIGGPTDPNAYSLTGKITITATELNAVAKSWQVQAYITILGFEGGGSPSDVVDIGGVVAKGADVGATVSGSLWEVPAVKLAKGDPALPGYNHSGYGVDPNVAVTLAGCLDPTGNTPAGPITTVLVGGGGATTTSPLLSDNANGIIFSFGEA